LVKHNRTRRGDRQPDSLQEHHSTRSPMMFLGKLVAAAWGAAPSRGGELGCPVGGSTRCGRDGWLGSANIMPTNAKIVERREYFRSQHPNSNRSNFSIRHQPSFLKTYKLQYKQIEPESHRELPKLM
jgi:hypothetical protein